MSAMTLLSYASYCVAEGSASQIKCRPLVYDEVIQPKINLYINSDNDTLCTFRLELTDDFKGTLSLDPLATFLGGVKATAVSYGTLVYLQPMIDKDRRVCEFVSEIPLKKGQGFRIDIPEGLLIIKPDFMEVDELDIDGELLSTLSVGGAWHKAGSAWSHQGMFSVIDDDSLDGQIPDSKPVYYTYGYYSLLYPLLEGLGLRGNLAVEGKRIGINNTKPIFNENGKTLVRLQNEKGWDLLCHSMECLGDRTDNWLVDSLESPLARQIFEEGPNYGCHPLTVSVFDMKSRKQYWPNAEKTAWEETPKRYIKPYVADYQSKKNLFFNQQHDIEWHWKEWKNRAEEFGIRPVGFVTHNSISSHSLVPEIHKVFPYGLSDIGTVNINYPPMLTSGVRSGLEGQSMAGYNGNSTDNTFNKDHYKRFCAQVDEAAEKGGWIIFNLHTYRDVWLNSLPGALVSEGGKYPDEWVIPMKGMDSANDPLTPPAHLGISDWSEWYPCPGTRLEMMWKVLKYAKEKGLKNVTCSEGFNIMGNQASVGYYNRGYKFGMDYFGLIDTDEVYPHYVVSATDEVSYYNPLVSTKYSVALDDADNMDFVMTRVSGKFIVNDGLIVWNTPDPSGVTLEVMDLTGLKTGYSSTNSIRLPDRHGICIVCAKHSGSVLGTVKVVN
ncbi:MAG: hypothetical protein K2L00_08715 [Muribaculaceae bacterium]|nr:hypothetical protein [Muribaculaceae bacterium]